MSPGGRIRNTNVDCTSPEAGNRHHFIYINGVLFTGGRGYGGLPRGRYEAGISSPCEDN
jgi:hypothetical protein